MRIDIVGSRGFPYVYSGYETFVSQVAPRLVARGHRVRVHCHEELFEERPTEFRGVELVYVGGSARKSLSQLSHSWRSVRRIVRRTDDRPDVALFVNVANGLFGPLLRLAGVRTAINVDGLEWARPKWSGLGGKVFYVAAHVASRTFDLLITDAKAMADVYQREFGAESKVIEYGADVWKSSEPERLGDLGLTAGDYFLIVGRLIPDNNVALLVQGFAESDSRRKLVVVGDVPYADSYAQAVKSIDDPRIVFTGYVRDQSLLRELYCGAFAYMHGHEHGGTNPALLKALGAGCAILALDTPFAREVLRNETHGAYFDKSAASVSVAVARAEASPEELTRQRAIAQQRIIDYYNWERIADTYDAVLRELVTKAPKP